MRWLLSHQAGLPLVDGPLTFEQACDWDPVIRALETQEPLWRPGTEHVYHSVTYGFLVGEVVRRISGRSLGTFFAEEVAAPLGLSAWIGLPEEQEDRVARIAAAAPFGLEELIAGMAAATGLDPDTVVAWVEAVWGADSVQARSGELGGALDNTSDYYTTRAWREAEFPAANMLSDARSVARMYAATVSDVDGVRLLDPCGGRAGDGRPDGRHPDAWAAAGTRHPGGTLLQHVARVLAGLPADADARAGVVRSPGLRRIDRLRGPRRRCRFRLCHQPLELPAGRPPGGEPGQGRPGLPRVTHRRPRVTHRRRRVAVPGRSSRGGGRRVRRAAGGGARAV